MGQVGAVSIYVELDIERNGVPITRCRSSKGGVEVRRAANVFRTRIDHEMGHGESAHEWDTRFAVLQRGPAKPSLFRIERECRWREGRSIGEPRPQELIVLDVGVNAVADE